MKPLAWQTINLDLPPKERWTAIVKPYKARLQDLVNTFKAMAGFVSKDLFKLFEALEKANADKLLDAMPAPYGDEIRGIAAGADLTLLDALICNLIYEISGACSVIIAQDNNGHIIHGHNLDTAANWNFTSGQWDIAEKLRAITTNLHYVKDGNVIFNSTTYVGYAGVFEGMKTGSFSISVNTRFDTTLYGALIRWITGKDRSGQFGTFLVRDSLTVDATYADAVKRLNSTKLMGPGYLAVAGVKAGEGAIMSRGAKASYGFWTLDDEIAKGKNYMVNTNWDHWLPDPFFDRRRVPADKCMDGVHGDEADFEHLFQVLSAKPTRNKMTCHSVMFSALEGRIESYQQYCKERGCRPFEGQAMVV